MKKFLNKKETIRRGKQRVSGRILRIAGLLVLAIVLVSCKKESTNKLTEIPFTEYSWAFTDCYWINPGSADSVIIINSETALEQYFTCTDSSYPEIDFAKNTLLFVSSIGAFSVEKVNLSQKSKNEYELKVDIMEAMIHYAGDREYTWFIAIITSKIPDVTKINLKVDVINLD
jgi:hypothetical protein